MNSSNDQGGPVSYIRTQSSGELLSNTFALYRRHFLIVVAAFAMLGFPALLAQHLAPLAGSIKLVVVLALVSMVTSTLAYAAMLTIISDACVGLEPDLRRAYRRMWRYFIPLIIAGVLQGLAILLGLVLLLIPGVIALVFFMFVSPVVILERRSGFEALRRSASLGKNFFWRNLGLVAVIAVIGAIAGGIIGATLEGVRVASEMTQTTFIILYGSVMAVLHTVVMPLGLTLNLLLYYDLRVRKEAYDLDQLSQELQY
jgi:hypothetical protein